jgi:8-oxo-dGTP pyrophosphatase MutT (NUDIX family)
VNSRKPTRATGAPAAREVPGAPSGGASRRPVQIFHRSAGAVVVDAETCLILRRGREWVFPKGHIEQDETPEQAAIREVREESGIEIAIVERIGSTRYEFANRRGATRHRKTVEWFLARRVAGDLVIEPIFDDGGFVARDDALARLTHEADQDVARRAFEIMAEPDA